MSHHVYNGLTATGDADELCAFEAEINALTGWSEKEIDEWSGRLGVGWFQIKKDGIKVTISEEDQRGVKVTTKEFKHSFITPNSPPSPVEWALKYPHLRFRMTFYASDYIDGIYIVQGRFGVGYELPTNVTVKYLNKDKAVIKTDHFEVDLQCIEAVVLDHLQEHKDEGWVFDVRDCVVELDPVVFGVSALSDQRIKERCEALELAKAGEAMQDPSTMQDPQAAPTVDPTPLADDEQRELDKAESADDEMDMDKK